MKLRQLIEKELNSGTSQRELASKIGVSHGTINNILAGMVPRRISTLCKFGDYFNMNPADLVYERFDTAFGKLTVMQGKSKKKVVLQHTVDNLRNVLQELEAFAKALPTQESSTDNSKLLSMADHVMVPKLDVRLAAGAGGSGTERVERSYAFDRSWIKGVLKANPTELRLVDVTGQSMEPTYWKGDLVLVDLSRKKLQHDHIYALRAADGPLIKRLCRDGKGWHLHSDNPDKKKYPDQPVQIEELEVVGEVLWLAGRRM